MSFFLNSKAALLTMTLAEMGMMVSTTSSPFSFKVVPVSTISTITSDIPNTGASSMDPLRWMISISRPMDE